MPKPVSFPVGGGLDLVTSPVAIKPGKAIAALNYEPNATGYQRFQGFERFDGQTAPSAVYSEAIEAGDTQAEAAAAREAARALIDEVPGTGPVRGVWFYDGKVYAFRDKDETDAGLYVATVAGWDEIETVGGDPGNPATTYTLRFTWLCGAGTVPLNVGNVITEQVSGATAVVRRIQLDAGEDPETQGSVTGYITINAVTGTWDAANNFDTVADSDVGFLEELPTAGGGGGIVVTLPAGGRYGFINHNFYGAANLKRMYGVNGVGRAFEFDGATLTPIITGMVVDTPHRIAVHNMALVLGFPGGSTQLSAVGDSLNWDAVLGASEIATGDEIVDYLPNYQESLVIFGANSISILYGNDSTDYVKKTISSEAGALPHTAQRLGQAVYMDNRGIRSLSTTAAFGNFNFGTMSRMIEPLLRDLRQDQVNPCLSLTVRKKDQCWYFFENQTGIILYIGKGKDPEILPFKLPIQAFCGCSVEMDGVERTFIGADDGYVYELNKGTSFDGAPIEHYVRFAFNHFGSPELNKNVAKVAVGLEAIGSTTLSVSVDLNLGSMAGVAAQELVVTPGGGAIDSLGGNEAYYASQIETVAEAYIGISAKNFSLKISGLTANEEPHTVSTVTYHLSPRGVQR